MSTLRDFFIIAGIICAIVWIFLFYVLIYVILDWHPLTFLKEWLINFVPHHKREAAIIWIFIAILLGSGVYMLARLLCNN